MGMAETQYDNASQRLSPTAHIYNIGVKEAKRRALITLANKNRKFASLHKKGIIHIHDLETYKHTYNCLQMDVLKGFPLERMSKYSEFRKITEIFYHYRNLIVKLGHEQSGGIGFPNFDEEISVLFERLSIADETNNLQILKDSIESFIDWSNEAHERICQYSFYVTLNLGLSTSKIGRYVTKCAIEYFMRTSLDVIKPNIIFKIKKGVNFLPEDPNYDMFCLAVKCTCKKMIPTYLLFDSNVNEMYDPWKVAIMGCRTKVVANIFGESRSIGRTNIDYISINLPRISLEIELATLKLKKNIDKNIIKFKKKWTEIANSVKDILLDRYRVLLERKVNDFPCNYKYNLWDQDFKTANSLEEIFKHGTLSVGFIGLSEAVEILTGEKYYTSAANHARAIDIVRHMREVVDGFKDKHQLNFTLLASSGELISGRFPEEDKKKFNNNIINKGYYTNSFHVDVDSGMHPIKKIQYEGPFHEYANGGCITYVEFSSAPINNTDAIMEVIDAGNTNGINYLGINFPLDRCRSCGETGTFDGCPKCGGNNIHRVRRVSGYLEDLEFFTVGKKAEVAYRKPNDRINNRGE